MVTAGARAATSMSGARRLEIMQEEQTGFERPGEHQPATGEPTPPPPQPDPTQQHTPPPGPAQPGGPGAGPGGPGLGGPAQPGGPGVGGPGQPGGPGYPAPGQPYPPHGGYPPPAPLRRLTRRMDNRVIGGVASGLGTYFGVDPVIFRIGFVALALAGGTGLLIYLLLWALLPAVSDGGAAGPPPPTGPAQGDPPIVAALRQGGAKSYLAIGAMILAVLLLVGPFARPTVVFALLLIGVGVLLMVQDRPEQAPGSASPWPPGSPTPPAGGQQPGEQWGQHGPGQAPQPSQGGQGPSAEPSGAAYATATQPVAHDDTRPAWDASTGQPPGSEWHPGAAGAPTTQSGWGSAASPAGWGAAPTSVAERRPRSRSMLGWLTVAAALLAVGVASALDNLGVVNLTPARIVALVLSVIGVGLLVGSVRGRAWWLILLGLLLVPVMAVASVASDVPVRGRTGQQIEQPLTLDAVQPEYRLSAGQLTLDLSHVDFGATPRRVTVRMGVGDLNVKVPDGQPVTVTSRIGAGEMTVFGRPSSGGLQVTDTVNEGGGSKLGRLTLDLHLGVGQIVVTRGP